MERDEWENGGQPPVPAQSAEEPSELTEPEELQRKLAALQAENRRLQTQVFAYERAMLALQRENESLEQRCEQLAGSLVSQPEIKQAQKPEPVQCPAAKPEDAFARAPGQAETQLERLSAELIEEFDRLMPGQK